MPKAHLGRERPFDEDRFLLKGEPALEMSDMLTNLAFDVSKQVDMGELPPHRHGPYALSYDPSFFDGQRVDGLKNGSKSFPSGGGLVPDFPDELVDIDVERVTLPALSHVEAELASECAFTCRDASCDVPKILLEDLPPKPAFDGHWNELMHPETLCDHALHESGGGHVVGLDEQVGFTNLRIDDCVIRRLPALVLLILLTTNAPDDDGTILRVPEVDERELRGRYLDLRDVLEERAAHLCPLLQREKRATFRPVLEDDDEDFVLLSQREFLHHGQMTVMGRVCAEWEDVARHGVLEVAAVVEDVLTDARIHLGGALCQDAVFTIEVIVVCAPHHARRVLATQGALSIFFGLDAGAPLQALVADGATLGWACVEEFQAAVMFPGGVAGRELVLNGYRERVVNATGQRPIERKHADGGEHLRTLVSVVVAEDEVPPEDDDGDWKEQDDGHVHGSLLDILPSLSRPFIREPDLLLTDGLLFLLPFVDGVDDGSVAWMATHGSPGCSGMRRDHDRGPPLRLPQ